MGFVFVHVVGNLKVYLGAEDFNHYGEFLRELLVPFLPRTVFLWLLRIGLIVAFVFHIHSAYTLTRMNRRARGRRLRAGRATTQAANSASRTMRWTGVIVGLFLIFHLADLTWGTANPDFVRGDVYRNFVATLRAARRSRSSTSSPTSPSASTCSTAPGRCSRASGSTTPAGTRGGAASPSGFAGV